MNSSVFLLFLELIIPSVPLNWLCVVSHFPPFWSQDLCCPPLLKEPKEDVTTASSCARSPDPPAMFCCWNKTIEQVLWMYSSGEVSSDPYFVPSHRMSAVALPNPGAAEDAAIRQLFVHLAGDVTKPKANGFECKRERKCETNRSCHHMVQLLYYDSWFMVNFYSLGLTYGPRKIGWTCEAALASLAPRAAARLLECTPGVPQDTAPCLPEMFNASLNAKDLCCLLLPSVVI